MLQMRHLHSREWTKQRKYKVFFPVSQQSSQQKKDQFRAFRGSRDLQSITGRVGSGRVRKCSTSHGSGRVGSKRWGKSHGSGQVMTRENRVTRGSGQHNPRQLLSTDPCGSRPRIRLADPTLESLPALFLPKGFSRTETQYYSFGIMFEY